MSGSLNRIFIVIHLQAQVVCNMVWFICHQPERQEDGTVLYFTTWAYWPCGLLGNTWWTGATGYK